MAMTGNGASLAFGTTTGFTPALIDFETPEQTREDLDDTQLGETANYESIADDLVQPGESRFTYYFDQSAATKAPITAAAETITLTYPLKSGESTAATLAGSGYIKSVRRGTLKNGELMIAEAVIKWDGKTGPTYTSGSA